MVFLRGGNGARSASVKAAEGPARVGLLDTERLMVDCEMLPPEIEDLLESLMVKLKDTTNKMCAMLFAK
jgi:hypothetical protein